MTLRKLSVLLALSLVVVGLAACSSWERRTYQSLTASKVVIDQAAADFNAGVIARTPANRELIVKARAAQAAAVRTFEEYAVMKVSRQSTTLAEQQALVIRAVDQIPPLIAAIQALYAKGAAGAR